IDVTLRIWKLGVITGRVFDEVSDPIAGITVAVLRRARSGGAERLTQVGSAVTDDLGVYRARGILPGNYIVTVKTTQTTVSQNPMDELAGANAALRESATNGLLTGRVN